MADTDVVVRLRAEVADLKGKLDEAGKRLDDFGTNASKSINAFGVAFAQVFAADKIAKFIIAGIKDFAEYERALDTLGKKVAGAGGNWAALKEDVVAYANEIQATTRFSDDVVIASLDELMSKTNDYTASLRLNEMAMNYSVYTGQSLSAAADIIGLAFQGNTRGTMMLAKELGITGAAAKDTQKLFDILADRTDNLARSDRSVATEMEIAKNAMADAGKEIGKTLAPTITWLLNVFAVALPFAINGFVKVIQSVATILGGVVFTVLSGIINANIAIVKSFIDLGIFMKDVITKGPKAAWETFSKSVATNWKDAMNNTTSMAKGAADQLAQIWKKQETAKKAQNKRELTDHVRVKRAEETASRSEAEIYQQLVAQKQASTLSMFTVLDTNRQVFYQKAGESLDDFKLRMKDAEEVAKAHATAVFDAISKAATTMTEAMGAAFQRWGESGALTARNLVVVMKEAATAILRGFLMSMGKEIFMRGLMSLIQAAAYAVGIVTIALAPGWFAKAALEMGEGMALMAAASTVKLASGGIVTRPTNALIGEAGPEAVIPLNKAGLAAIGGVQTGDISMNFPGVRRESDLKGKRFAQTADRQLAEAMQRSNQRRGQRFT